MAKLKHEGASIHSKPKEVIFKEIYNQNQIDSKTSSRIKIQYNIKPHNTASNSV